MKRIVLLFTILCVNALNGMEQGQHNYWDYLPKELKQVIMHILVTTGDTIDEAVNNIKQASRINKELNQMLTGNIKGFTALVHILANKFNVSPIGVAGYFEIPIADKYKNLYDQLVNAVVEGNLVDIKRLIAEEADITAGQIIIPALRSKSKVAVIKLLLENGANPFETLESVERKQSLRNFPEYQQIKSLLEEAMAKPGLRHGKNNQNGDNQ